MRIFLLAATFSGFAIASSYAQDATGEWLVKDKSAKIKIIDCNDALWGVISAEKTPGFDSGNRDPSMKGRPLLGVPILIDLKQTDKNSWEGKIYDPQGNMLVSAGPLYTVKIKLAKDDLLEVRGCVLGICDGEDWTRVPSPNTPSTAARQPGTLAKSKSVQKSDPAVASSPDPVCQNAAGMVPKN